MELKEIFKYRNIWMAIAIIMIVFFHLDFISTNIIIKYIKSIGYGGVDIFLFASGIGCYYSLQKSPDISTFIKKRILKIIPTYWCFLIFYFIFKFTTDGIPLSAIIGNIFCVQSLIGLGNDFNWYMSAMWIFYFLSPYFVKIANKINSWKKVILITILFIIFSFAFWNTENLIIIITRFPIFFIGMYIAKKSTEKKKTINKKEIMLLTFLMVLGFSMLSYFKYFIPSKLWSHGLHWYPFILITPGLCFIISYISKAIEKYNIGAIILKFLGFIGKYTFEIYLVHILMNSIIEKLVNKNGNIKCVFVLLWTILGCIILRQLTKLVLLTVEKIKQIIVLQKSKKCRKMSKKQLTIDK